MKYPYYIVDVFSDEAFGGNQLAVLPRAAGISAEGMQKIALEFNFAETSFVFPPDDETTSARVRIFTPRFEVDFAGHPTVGTACALVYGGQLSGPDIILGENIGPVPVRVDRIGDLLRGTLTTSTALEQPATRPDQDALAQLLSLENADIDDGFFAGAGLNFCFAHLASRDAVDRARIDMSSWRDHFADSWSPHIYLFSGDMEDGAELYARMFAPAAGIDEDPATGSAVVALVGVAASKSRTPDSRFSLSVLQGVHMGRPSTMSASANLDNGILTSLSVGGASCLVATGEIEVGDKWLEQ